MLRRPLRIGARLVASVLALGCCVACTSSQSASAPRPDAGGFGVAPNPTPAAPSASALGPAVLAVALPSDCQNAAPSSSPEGPEGLGTAEARVRWSRSGNYAVRIQRASRSLGPSPFNIRSVDWDRATLLATAPTPSEAEVTCCPGCREQTVSDAAVSPDDKLLVLSGSMLCVLSLPDLRILYTSRNADGELAFGAGRTPLVQSAGGALRIWDVNEHGELNVDEARQIPRLHLLEGGRVALHPQGWEAAVGGQRTAAARGTGGDPPPANEPISLWDVDNGKPMRWLKGGTKPVSELRYSPEGSNLAALHRGGSLLFYAARKPPAREVSAEASAFAFADEAQLLFGTSRGEARMAELGGEAPAQLVAMLNEPIVNVVAHSTGWSAAQGRSGRVIIRGRSGNCRTLDAHGAVPGGLTLSPDGRRLGVIPAEGAPLWLRSDD